MKVDFIKCLIATIISSLLGYCFYTFAVTAEYNTLLLVGSLITLIITSILSLATTFEPYRTNTLIKTVSIIFFFVMLISNSIFTMINFKVELYVIINGLLLMVYFLGIYSLAKAKQ